MTQYLMDNYLPCVGYVLDYGSGKVPHQTELLRRVGFDVSPVDLPENNVIGVHASPREVFTGAWDVVLLSNVLNVMDNVDEAAALVANLFRVHKPRAIIFNLPNAPCHWQGWGKAVGPAGRRSLLNNRLMGTLLVRDYRIMQKHPYSGGVVYVIDNGQAPKEQPQSSGTKFGGY